MLIHLVFIGTLVSYLIQVDGVFLGCEAISSADCAYFPVYLSCGSDGKQYHTRCDFAKAHCKTTSLKMIHKGPCVSTTLHKATPTVTSLSPLCEVTVNEPCSNHVEEVCASNGVTYTNLCQFRLKQCYIPSLGIIHRGACP